MANAIMSDEDGLDVFRSEDAILDGHFILSFGLYSTVFLQKAQVYRAPAKTIPAYKPGSRGLA